MLRVSFETLHETLQHILLAHGFTEARAVLCARLFAEASLDGVASHGLNRFPRFIEMVRRGVIDVHAEPECLGRFGSLERWTGHRGPGNLNAYHCMARAIELAKVQGIGCVALQRTNHWMRGGTYGWQAAEAGVIGLCWTNTNQNLPPWGAVEPRIGNNPLIFAVPREAGPVVLDMAMSQFSYGALYEYRRRGARLPVPGGYDEAGRLTRDPGAIEDSMRPLPIGYWKGSGLSVLLDLVAALLSGGLATHRISSDPLEETDLSQVFMAFEPAGLPGDGVGSLADEVVAHLHASTVAEEGGQVRYPGEGTLRKRRQNQAEGIPVDPEVWDKVQAM